LGKGKMSRNCAHQERNQQRSVFVRHFTVPVKVMIGSSGVRDGDYRTGGRQEDRRWGRVELREEIGTETFD
jgi:hypothetical protein